MYEFRRAFEAKRTKATIINLHFALKESASTFLYHPLVEQLFVLSESNYERSVSAFAFNKENIAKNNTIRFSVSNIINHTLANRWIYLILSHFGKNTLNIM